MTMAKPPYSDATANTVRIGIDPKSVAATPWPPAPEKHESKFFKDKRKQVYGNRRK